MSTLERLFKKERKKDNFEMHAGFNAFDSPLIMLYFINMNIMSSRNYKKMSKNVLV